MTIAKSIVRIFILIVGIFIGVFVIFALFIAGSLYATIPWHNFMLWRMDRTLETTAHPANSQFVEKHKFFGSRYTDISECTFAVGEIRSTSLSRDEVLHAYNMPMHIVIIEESTSMPLDNPADAWIAQFLNAEKSKTDTTYYLIYLYEKGRPWWGDFRCHE